MSYLFTLNYHYIDIIITIISHHHHHHSDALHVLYVRLSAVAAGRGREAHAPGRQQRGRRKYVCMYVCK